MAETLSLTGANGVSEIHIETGLLDRAGAVILETFSPSRVHIVSDSTVAPLYLEKLEKQFSLPVTHTVIPAGEEHKQLSTVEGIYHDLLTAGMTRKDLIIALGGGVVGDITGFAAATFLRGVSLCQSRPRCSRRWIPRSAARPAWIFPRAKTSLARSISAARAHRPERARFPAGQHLCGRHGRGR